MSLLRTKTFLKKTKRGKILKIVREHYLRDDIGCGSELCEVCPEEQSVLERAPPSESDLLQHAHYILPDTNVVLHQLDVIEDASIRNVILLKTVLDEVRHRSAPAYKRIREILQDSKKCFYVFVNEHHKDTYIERQPGESSNDRNDRAIRNATRWYQKHLELTDTTEDTPLKVVLLTNDQENMNKAKAEGIIAMTVQEYVKSMKTHPELLDKLSHADSGGMPRDGKLLYPEHLPLSALQRGIKSGRFLQGSFQPSRDNYLEANVCVQDQEDSAVFIRGYEHLNRAMQGDSVVIEMLSKAEWSCPSSMVLEDDDQDKEEEEVMKEASADTKVSKGPKLPSGKVVGIIKRKWRQYCGILQPSSVKEATRHLFIPAERRVPKIRIETRQAASLLGQRIVVAIDSWPRHSRYPQGHFVRKLGNVGDKDTENEVLLLEHDVPHSKFSEAVLACLPKLPWIITDEDLKRRRDLRAIPICSVDPPGCTDIDDALHCIELENGNLQVGVHIADVSHFIRPGTAIDREAQSRGTTVYLTDQRIDMVPELLSSNLCSLRSDGDRFAFSTIWEMTEDAEIVNVQFTKSVIRSKASLTYAQAQLIIDDPTKTDALAKGLRGLNRIAKILKRRRIEAGALTLASTEIRFTVDSETHDPVDVVTKQLLETNSMVEEFMLLANVATAKKTFEDFQDCACLRRHPSPPASNFDPLLIAAKSKGFELDVNSGKGLADSLEKAVDPSNPYTNTMLRIMTTRCMMQAVYFCSGMIPEADFIHYGLAAPIYTHFTSPIRRYSDIIVHRLLAVTIGADASYPELLDKKKTQATCLNLNYRHKMAQYAGRASVALHTQLFFRERVQDEEGYILFVRKNAIQVLIPKFGLEGTIYLDNEKGENAGRFTFNEEEATQTAGDVVLRVFNKVIVQISIDRSNIQHQKLSLKLVTPEIPGFSVPAQPAQDDQPPPAKKQKK